MKMFEYDSGPMRFANLLFDLTRLNLLWLLCSVPLITMGASTAAMYYAAGKLMDGDSSVFKNFKEGFKMYWKPSTIIWLIFSVLGTAFYMAYHLLTTVKVPGWKALFILAVLAFVTLLFIMLWIYAVMVNFKGSTSELLFNAFIFSFLYAPITIISAGFYALAGYLFLRYLPARVLCIVFGHALVVYLSLTLYRMAFKKHQMGI